MDTPQPPQRGKAAGGTLTLARIVLVDRQVMDQLHTLALRVAESILDSEDSEPDAKALAQALLNAAGETRPDHGSPARTLGPAEEVSIGWKPNFNAGDPARNLKS